MLNFNQSPDPEVFARAVENELVHAVLLSVRRGVSSMSLVELYVRSIDRCELLSDAQKLQWKTHRVLALVADHPVAAPACYGVTEIEHTGQV